VLWPVYYIKFTAKFRHTIDRDAKMTASRTSCVSIPRFISIGNIMVRSLYLSISLIFFLTSCGLKGPLYLPQDNIPSQLSQVEKSHQ
jgi:predicted small lipoprotein YifL